MGQPDQVGILGQSMGGFVASTAFGLEPRVPALWVESGVYDPRDILLNAIAKNTGPLAHLFFEFSWFLANRFAGVPDLCFKTPAKTVPQGGETARRSVAFVQNR